ncbi:hypothetical protein [Salinilacihabitans rarus]|uniref:hypothetical protein n=1 Tax=Salinilacihabitans rarus TaxID=2961596 RepID=UPI0020C8EE90|nr:hypothetical protein [Salinilacihabitans rarus]
MRFKLVPAAPPDLSVVETVREAVPLVPGSEDDCCARIVRRTPVDARDEAATWLTFLRALDLAAEGPAGFRRRRDADPAPGDLRRAFRERVYGAEAVLEILDAAADPLPADDVYERFRGEIPAYEREKYGDRLDEVWRERVRRLLDWAVLLDLAERTDGGYRRG